MVNLGDDTPPEILDLDEPEERPPGDDALADQQPVAWSGDELLFIDVRGRIHVRGGRHFTSRVVGSVRGADAEAVLGDLVARFGALTDRLDALEREVRGTRNLVRGLKSVRSFIRWAEGADAVGDFETLLDRAHALADGLDGCIAESRHRRRELVEGAEGLGSTTRWREGAAEAERLMEAWKDTTPVGDDEDEELWRRFRAARRAFFAQRSQHFKELKRTRREATEAKEALIARAEATATSTDWDAASAEMRALMDEWRQAGSAGAEADDRLWGRFQAARDPFFTARREARASERQARPERRPKDRGEGRRQRDSRRPGGGGRGREAPALRATLAEIAGSLDSLRVARGEPEDDGPRGRGKAGGGRRR